MDEPSAQYLTVMHSIYRGCNIFEASIIFSLTIIIAILCALLSKIVWGYFLVPLLLIALITQTAIFKYLCGKYGEYKSNKPPGVANLKIREYLSYIGIKSKHVTRAGIWRVGGNNV